MSRELKYHEAINEAIDQCMAADPSVYIMGLGVPDPNAIQGTTRGLREKYGDLRGLDTPASENGMTGAAIGSAIVGMRPILTHHRVEFALLSMEQIVNQAAKWHYVFGRKVPMVVRMLIGRGWGQGPQHSQSLQALFAHIPGLKVALPATPHDAKGLLTASIEDDNPVLVLEHRWLYNTYGDVPEAPYRVPLGSAATVRPGSHITVAACSHMVLEALRCAEFLTDHGVDAEVIDLRSVRPLDIETITESVGRTGHLLVADIGWTAGGVSGEVVAAVTERAFDSLRSPPKRVGLPPSPTPASPSLAKSYYPRARDLAVSICATLGVSVPEEALTVLDSKGPIDVPDSSFTGPF